MNIDDFKKELLNLDTEMDKEVSLSNLKLSAIVYENFALFESIKDKHQRKVKDNNAVKSCYSRKIQALLTKGGKFQKDGSPISEYQILNEMYRVRKLKGLIESPIPIIDNETSFKAPTTDFHSSGVVKVSPKNNKKVVALNNGVVEPTKIENMAKATHILEQEIKIYKKDGVMPVWSSNDEWSLIDFKRQAGIEKVNVSQLAIKGVLTPRYNQDIIDYFEAWLNKAYVCEKLFKD